MKHTQRTELVREVLADARRGAELEPSPAERARILAVIAEADEIADRMAAEETGR